MPAEVLSTDEIKTLEMLSYFFYVMGLDRKAQKTAQAIMSVDPDNSWARGMMAALAFRNERYDLTLSMTSGYTPAGAKSAADREMCKLRARALFKTGQTDKARAMMSELLGDISR